MEYRMDVEVAEEVGKPTPQDDTASSWGDDMNKKAKNTFRLLTVNIYGLP